MSKTASPTLHNTSHWPASLDLAQSATGLALALFMWFHMGFVSAILISEDAAWVVARFFEGYFIFGRALPWLVSTSHRRFLLFQAISTMKSLKMCS